MVRPQDVKTVKGLVSDLQTQYKDKYGNPVMISVVEGLSQDSSGGIQLVSHQEKIVIDNTLEQRLRLIEELMLPIIRTDLFGPNPNRRFFT